ncbi:MAG TPA: DMT family transporter [Mobilitalea sp.]|nr:DMT family transporter [Mobilitalea sp.]
MKKLSNENKEQWIAYGNLALAMFISGSAVVVSKMMVSALPTFLATELGLMTGLIILIPLTFIKQKETLVFDPKTNLILFAQAICGVFLYRIFTFIGLMYTTAATSGLITSASPMVVFLLAGLLLKEKLTLKQLTAILITVTGLFIINLYSYLSGDAEPGSMKGNLLILAAVLCEGLFSILSKVSCKPVSALYRTTIIDLYAFLLLLPFTFYDAWHYNFMKLDSRSIFCIVYYGVFVSFLSYIFWFRGIEKTKAGNAAVFTSVVPISSILLSVIILKEHIHAIHLISLILIVSGIWLSCKDAPARSPRKEYDSVEG